MPTIIRNVRTITHVHTRTISACEGGFFFNRTSLHLNEASIAYYPKTKTMLAGGLKKKIGQRICALADQ